VTHRHEYDSFTFAEYFSDVIKLHLNDKVIGDDGKTVIITSPRKGGLSYEAGIVEHLMRKYGNYSQNSFDSFRSLEGEFKREGRFHNDSSQKLLISDDCLITGKAIRARVKNIIDNEFFKASGMELAGIVVGLDCSIFGKSGKRVSAELKEEFGVPVESIVDIEEIMEYFSQNLIIEASYPIKDYWFENYRKKDFPPEAKRDQFLRGVGSHGLKGCESNTLLDDARNLFDMEVYEHFLHFMKTQRENYDKDISEIPKLMKRKVA
jgi:orotate phosphoribosyltransferase